MSGSAPIPAVPFREAVAAWTRVALTSFGGPAGQIAVIHRVVVEEKRWVDEPRFLHALSYCMLLPGPEAQQLATYLGWLLHGTRGALVAGGLFILPGFLTILALSLLYVGFRETTLLTGIFLGLKPAVFAIVLHAVWRLGKRALGNWVGVALALAAFVASFALRLPFPLIIAGAAALGFLSYRERLAGMLPIDPPPPGSGPSRPPIATALRTATVWALIWLVPIALLLLVAGPTHTLTREGIFFSKAAVVTFGGAYAVLAYVAHQAVEVHGWLQPAEMLDGLGLAESTPGPLIMVVQFVAFLGAYRYPGTLDPLTAGLLGSVITTWVTFVPSFLFILTGAPYIEYLRGHRGLNAALAGIMAAVVGVVLNLAIWFGLHTLFGSVGMAQVGPLELAWPDPTTVDWAAAAIALGALGLLQSKRVGLLPLLGMAMVAGLVVQAVR